MAERGGTMFASNCQFSTCSAVGIPPRLRGNQPQLRINFLKALKSVGLANKAAVGGVGGLGRGAAGGKVE